MTACGRPKIGGMKLIVWFVACGCALALPVRAQDAQTPAEPVVKHTVIEDQGSRIEELRVRGQTQRITVTPKVGTKKSYEIITPDGSRDTTDSASATRGAAGKRVWHVLSV